MAWLTANIRMWMCDVAAAWLMTTVSRQPVLVGMGSTRAAIT